MSDSVPLVRLLNGKVTAIQRNKIARGLGLAPGILPSSLKKILQAWLVKSEYTVTSGSNVETALNIIQAHYAIW